MAQRYSSSRLAKELGVDAKQVFQQLQQAGCISREDEQWQLTEQGLQLGGEYQQSEKFGQFISWPSSLLEHAMFKHCLPDLLSATRIAQQYELTPKLVNQLFAELGLIERDQRGWTMTKQAEKLGAEQRNSKQGLFVLWPKAMLDNSLIATNLKQVAGLEPALCLDGRKLDNIADQKIANWLYLNQLAFAYDKALAFSELRISFYLPVRRVYIAYWGMHNIEHSLSKKMQQDTLIQQLGLRYIEINDEQLKDLEGYLSQKLLQFGLQL